ncbi:MAG: pyridoxamine 5'-phosphate oxidase family protein [Gemmatimonadota bacterium]|nr:pyridoxamine 5'-phosphate oxidase family protein [Gemmatimonadota bacterium]
MTPNSEQSPDQPDQRDQPSFHSLTRDESERLLARNNVGRIAFSFHDRVDIEPIHYVFDSGWIYGRTGEGTKLSTLEHHPWVAFEVDEVKGIFEWRSVVVKGAFYLVEADTSMQQDPAFKTAIELLRTLVPETLRSDDPVPFRRVVFRIHLDEVTGRAATAR